MFCNYQSLLPSPVFFTIYGIVESRFSPNAVSHNVSFIMMKFIDPLQNLRPPTLSHGASAHLVSCNSGYEFLCNAA